VKRKSALSRSPNQTLSRRSIATTVNQSPLGRELDFDGNDMLLEDDTTTSPNSRRQSRRETIATDGAVPSPSMTNRNRQSTASRRSDAQEEDEDEGEGGDVEQPEQSYEFDNDVANEGGGQGEYDEDVSAEEDEAEAELGLDGDDNVDDENGQEPEDEDTGEETAVERAAPKAKRTEADKVMKAKAKARPRADSRQRQGSSESSDTSPIKRARVSGFPLPGCESDPPTSVRNKTDPAADEDHEYKGDFKCRRSGRSHIAPLKWWIGEHVEYQPGRHLAEVREVVRKAEAARPSFAAQRKAGRKTSKPARSESVADPDIRDGTGFDAGCKQFAVVWDFPTNTQDDHRRQSYCG
jgi:centromere protein C